MTMRRRESADGSRQGTGPRLALLFAMLSASLCALPAAAQQGMYGVGIPGTGAPGARGQFDHAGDPSADATDVVIQEKRLQALNAERQRQMVADANRLAKLAAELNAEVNGPNPRNLSPAQLRKVAEIEKLARSVRDKMCTSFRGIPPPVMPVQPVVPPGLR